MIHKLNGAGETTVTYQGEVVESFGGGVRVEARWERPVLDLGYARFEPGDRFIEWYFGDRWYNIFEIHRASTGALKGWYCNVVCPASINTHTIMYRDLLLDLWVTPDGTMMVLDEDEFAADTTLDADLRAGAKRGLAELQSLVSGRQPPFDAIAPAGPADPSGRISGQT
jgi:uncharacterized protein